MPCPDFSQLPDEITRHILERVEEVVTKVVEEAVAVSNRCVGLGSADRGGNPYATHALPLHCMICATVEQHRRSTCRYPQPAAAAVLPQGRGGARLPPLPCTLHIDLC